MLKDMIRRILYKKDKLRCLVRCVHNLNNAQFRERIFEINNNNSLVDIEKYGTENRNKALFYIDFTETGNGFFAEYRKLLNALYFADQYGLIPVVEYSKEFSYAEKEPVRGITNPYEYYYKQPGNISLEEMKRSNTVINYREENRRLAEEMKPENGYFLTEEYEKEMATIIRKYIRYSDYVEHKLNEDIKGLLQSPKVLGVHVRGTDFKKGYNRHPNYVHTQEYIESAKQILEKNTFDKIYLATDDSEAVTLFRQEFGDKLLVYEDVLRSDGEQSVMLSKHNRQNHKFQLGYEVIRDMHTLAMCNGLVAGMSQVSAIAKITKISFSQEYEVIKILDKGIAKNHKVFKKDYDKASKS